MSIVVPIRACVCGCAGRRRVLELKGDFLTFNACDICVATGEAFLARVRPIFDAMIACGVPRDVANETMSFMLDRVPDDSALETAK